MQYSIFDTQSPIDTFSQPQLASASLYVREASGAFVVACDKDILEAARQVADKVIPKGQALDKPELVKPFFTYKLNSTLEHEVFAMAMLDSQFKLIEYVEPFRGTLTQATVYPREVVKMVLECNAAAIIIGHNHPSGTLEPSEADKSLTKHLKQALALVDVRLLDHILVADNKTLSFAERGFL